MAGAKQRAVIFDFDGVIADSWKLHESAWRKVLKDHKAKLDDDAFRKALGWNTLETAKTIAAEAGLSVKPEDLADEKKALFLQRMAKELPVMPGAENALKRLKGEFLIAITAGRAREVVTAALRQFGLDRIPDVVLTSNDLKPTDELDDLIGLAAERLGLKPEQCAMIDDSRNGLLAAKRVGMKTIAFDSNPEFEMDSSMADAQVGSLEEVVPELVTSVIAGPG
jgi:HAD superfamily hydrolase (TIGR01509 family)